MNLRTFTMCWLAILPGAISTVYGAIVYVDADSPGGDGSSWAEAFKHLQDGLAVADANDEIRVAQGTYLPDRSTADPNGSGDRSATIHLVNGVSIRGGYAGLGEPDPDERDIERYETVLSGDLAGNDGPDFLNNDENSYHVVTGSGTDANAVFDGFAVVAGNANVDKPNDRGAGMYNYHGSPTVINCTFSGNYAKLRGGGMFNGGEDFDEDEKPEEGYVSSRVVVTGCTFRKNLVGYQYNHSFGAGMCNNCYSKPEVTGCTFIDNTAGTGNDRGRGGGMFNGDYSSVLVTDCIFIGNSGVQHGGGISNNEDSMTTLVGCTFIGNRTDGGGGAVFSHDLSSLTASHCTFSGNSAEAGGGATYNRRMINATYVNCIFSGNSTTDWWGGGAMFSHHGFIVLTNCTFTGNSASNGSGGGICNDWINGSVLSNCIFWDNIANEGPQIALTNTWGSCSTSVNHSAIQGGQPDIFIQDALLDWGEGNIGEDLVNHDPRFVEPGYGGRGTWEEGDYHLRWNSPCINGGDPSGDYAGLVDMDGEPRVMGGSVDMGADEVGEKQTDFTRDGIINLRDFSVLSQSWLSNVAGNNWYVLCDLHEDERIDALDVAEFAAHWLWEANWHEP